MIWGQVREGKTGREIVLRLTGSRDRPSGGAFPMEHEISIPLPDVQMVFPVIRLAVAAEASGYEDMRGLGVGEELSQWIQQVEKSPTARSSQVRWLLARAYQARADRKGDADLFRQTLRQLDDMLTMAPRSDEPLIWARLQGMYGSVLQDWELTDPSDVMAVTAISKFVLAAEELTADRTPLDFVLVHNQLGLLQRRTAELFQSEPPLCRAVDMFWKASEISYDSDVPRYMDITLRGVQRSLSDLTRRLPTGQKPDCNPPIPETVWRTYLAGERM